jgi:protein involved in polysaccharide export with SLBB domain
VTRSGSCTRWLLLGLIPAALLGGCEKYFKVDQSRWFDPSRMVKAPEGAPINPILPSASPADQTQDIYPNATFPQAEDWQATDRDYVIGNMDILDISILDLYQEGIETLIRRQVSLSGYIDLPLLPQNIRAEGLTSDQLKEAIVRAYSPEIIREPTVSVMVVQPHQNIFSAMGSIARPATYNITRKEMRLLEALATAGGMTQTNLKYMYVFRHSRPRAAAAAPSTATQPAAPVRPTTPSGPIELPPLPEIPQTQPSDVESGLRELGGALRGVPSTQPAAMTHLADMDPMPATAAAPKVMFINGQYVVVEPDAAAPAAATQPSTQPCETPSGERDPFGWAKSDMPDGTRIIAIDIKLLQQGDPRMDIVIRDNDVIFVPTLDVGEFYIMGEVARPGVYSLTGRQVTVKMAIAAAGNTGALAWPENSILIRRIGANQEQIIPLNIEAIVRGTQPDMFLKPDDVVAVGSDFRTDFLAVVRNAFRLTYGFGFIYDRNFANPYVGPLDSRRFTRW